jgi:hypothetical protein
MAPSSDYRKAYEAAKQELADLLTKQKEIEQRTVVVRQSLQTLASLCETEGISIEPSIQASYLLENSSLADEIRAILKAAWPMSMRPNLVKDHLVRLGHDLSQYQNPQASIHMVLKRMAESKEVEEQVMPKDGKQAYQFVMPKELLTTTIYYEAPEKQVSAMVSRAMKKKPTTTKKE